MTKQEQIDKIKKSLAICVGASCEGCAYHDNLTCIDTLKDDARSLIIKQEKKIKKLKAENKQLKTECTLLDDELRIARQGTIDVLNKLKEKFKGYEAWYYDGIEESYHDLEEEINEFIKELISNAKDKS